MADSSYRLWRSCFDGHLKHSRSSQCDAALGRRLAQPLRCL